MTDLVLILTTVAIGEHGDTIARTLVGERLAACVSFSAPMTSVYRWKDNIESDIEQQVVIKTTRQKIAAVRERLGELHPYELPEFVVIEVADGSAAYVQWVTQSVGETR